MRALLLVTLALTISAGFVSAAQSDESYYERVVAGDDRTSCDEVGWALLAEQMTSTVTEEELVEHAACSGGATGLLLMVGCLEPIRRTLGPVGPDLGEVWVSCTVMMGNLTNQAVTVTPADLSLVDAEGNSYPYSLEASAVVKSVLRPQELAVGSDPAIGLPSFEIPEDVEPPYLIVWEPAINGKPSEPVWIAVDRFIELPEPQG